MNKSAAIRAAAFIPLIMIITLVLGACTGIGPIVPEDDGSTDVTPTPEEQIPTYLLNATNWADGPPSAFLETAVNGMEVTALGHGTDPSPAGGLSLCSYNFGDGTPPVETPADEAGNCGPVTHAYGEKGGYNIVFAVWDNQGMIGQHIQSVAVGDTPGDAARIPSRIANCLGAVAWIPDRGPPFPAIVHYTPYQIEESPPNKAFLASGLAFVEVTNRGQEGSCDPADLFGEIAQSDLLLIDEWITNQPWSTGEYCLYGHSGSGLLGTLSSSVAPPGLKCAFVGGADTQLWGSIATKSGAWWPLGTLWVFNTFGQATLVDTGPRTSALIEYLTEIHAHTRTPIFEMRDREEELRTLNIPIFFETSWDDLAWGAAPLGGPYLGTVQAMIHPGSAVVIYPGPHPSFDPSNLRPFRGAYAEGIALPGEARSFLLSYLKGEGDPVTMDFNYLYFQLQGGVQAALMNNSFGGWKTSAMWPPEGATPIILYLSPEASGTIASRYDGSLALEAPGENLSLTPFPYQPAPYWDPVYSSTAKPWDFYTFPDLRSMDLAGISFTSPVFTEDAIVQGPLHLTLTAETDLYDFDWMVVLSDVWLDGSSHRLSSGFLRASLRNGYELYDPRPSGEQEYHITLASIANVFQAGHRLRITLHQVNADDIDPARRSTTLHLGAARAELLLHADAGIFMLEPYRVCDACEPTAVAAESLNADFERYITGAVTGIDPVSGADVGIGLWVRWDNQFNATGGVMATLPDVIATAVGVESITPSNEEGYDYLIGLPEDYSVLLRCGIEGDPGTALLSNGSTTVGPIVIQKGSIRCYDVPYVNW
jgi:predicted acyl esterase